MVKARMLVTKPILVGSVRLELGDVYAELTFPTQAIADHYRAMLKWSAIQVVVDGDAEQRSTVATQPVKDMPEAADVAAKLIASGIVTIGDVAKANDKLLRSIVGADNAGPLKRAAKCRIAGIAPRKAAPPIVEPDDNDDQQADATDADATDVDTKSKPPKKTKSKPAKPPKE